jgi:DnaJ family protein C protein 7
VTRDATDAEIKRSYRKKAPTRHPDRHGNSIEEQKKKAEETFRDMNLAHEVLSDPQKKQQYDEGVEGQDLDNPHVGPGGHDMGCHGGIDPNVLFQMFMQQQAGMGGMGSSGHNSFHFGQKHYILNNKCAGCFAIEYVQDVLYEIITRL